MSFFLSEPFAYQISCDFRSMRAVVYSARWSTGYSAIIDRDL